MLREQNQYVLHSLQGAQGRPAKKRRKHTGSKQRRKENKRLGDSPEKSPVVTCKQSFKVHYKLKEEQNQRSEVARCSTDWSCSQSTVHVRLVGVPGWECLTLHHVAAGRFSGEIFKGLQYED